MVGEGMVTRMGPFLACRDPERGGGTETVVAVEACVAVELPDTDRMLIVAVVRVEAFETDLVGSDG